jgi:hypothetical protein
MERSEAERKLCEGIDGLLEEAEGMDRTGMSYEERIDLLQGNVNFRKQLAGLVRDMVEARKVSEQILAQRLREVRYEFVTTIGSDGLEYRVGKAMPPCGP